MGDLSDLGPGPVPPQASVSLCGGWGWGGHLEVSKHPFQPWHLETAHSRSGWDLGHQARAICCVPSVGQEWERVMGKHSGEKATPRGPHRAACDEQGQAGGFVTASSPVSSVSGCLPREGQEELGYIYLLRVAW